MASPGQPPATAITPKKNVESKGSNQGAPVTNDIDGDDDVDGGKGGGAGRGRWGEELEAAMAAGAVVAEEAGGTGGGLMSRMALESVGLLVEGLSGQQVIFY